MSGETPAAVWVSPGRMGGEPCIYGHRLTTEAIARLHRDGADVLGLYPQLTAEQVDAAVAFEDWRARERAAALVEAEWAIANALPEPPTGPHADGMVAALEVVRRLRAEAQP